MVEKPMSESWASTLTGKNIILGISGSIAAFKAAILARELERCGACVRVILTSSAEKFIGRATFEGLGFEVYQDLWSGPHELHVSLAQWADLIVVAPSTADLIARLANGHCNELLSATILCAEVPIWIAPAMHPSMWKAEATQENIEKLNRRGI